MARRRGGWRCEDGSRLSLRHDDAASETAHPVLLRVTPIDSVAVVAGLSEIVRQLADRRSVLGQRGLVDSPTGLRQLARPLQPVVSPDRSKPSVFAGAPWLVDEARALGEHERRVLDDLPAGVNAREPRGRRITFPSLNRRLRVARLHVEDQVGIWKSGPSGFSVGRGRALRSENRSPS